MAASPSPTTWRSLATFAPRSASWVRRTSPGLSSTRRIRISSSTGNQLLGRLDVRHGEMESAAAHRVPVEPDPTADAGDDLVAEGQTDTCPRVFAATVEPLEHEEDAVAVDLGDTDAVVLNGET